MKRPTLLTGPYLAMWCWLIVPLTLHVLLPPIDFSDRYLSLHIGGWVYEIERAQNFGDALQIMWRERFYEVCEYLRLGTDTTSLVAVPAEDQRCTSVRVMRIGEGRLLAPSLNANLIDLLIRDLK